MKDFSSTAQRHGTDKFQHGYMPFYNTMLSEAISTILEIGCYKGASLRMWKELYPSAQIHTIDLFGSSENISKNEIEKEGFIAYKGDQSDIKFLSSIKTQFDLIIDDGSHNADHQQITFKHLFRNNLNKGGMYVVEDLHCCTEEYYWNNRVKCFEDTMLWAVTNYLKQKKMQNVFFDNTGFENHFEQVWLFMDKIAFFKKSESY